ncbi:MAG: hypothetical protein JNL06_10870 [Alphaproteobacteria bacterium]|nr:hypothetical protein [Alphaproteobacteria bacterium]
MSASGFELNPNALGEALRALAAPIFAATTTGRELTVHVAAVPHRRSVKLQIIEALAGFGAERLRIRFHAERDLLSPRSLERLVSRFTGDEIVYDPTGSVARAKALIAAAHTAREALGTKVGGLFYAPRLRTLFVALNAKQIAVGEKVRVGELAEIERRLVGALRHAFAGRIQDCPALRVGFGVPGIELVAVDQRSVVGFGARAVRAVRRYWKPVAIAAMFGFGANAAAAKDPAVSQTNLKVTGTGGQAEDEGAWFVNGILTAPLGNSWGFQLEAAGAGVDDQQTLGGAAHLFTRDPESYLLGLFAAYASESEFDVDATRLGAEAEIYLDQVSILVAAGYQFSDDVEETAFGDIELRWYVTDNFAIGGGGSFQEDTSVARLSAEWQPGFSALPGLAFRVDGALGDDDYDSIMGGITYYFGANASLKDRHRRQDPNSALIGLLHSVQQEQKRLTALYGPN